MIYGKKKISQNTQLDNTCAIREGETIEKKLARLVSNDESIEMDMTPEIYQERNAGVDPFCDIRTDRMAMAQEAQDNITRTHLLARANREDMGKKKADEFTYVTDTNGNIVKNPIQNPTTTE